MEGKAGKKVKRKQKDAEKDERRKRLEQKGNWNTHVKKGRYMERTKSGKMNKWRERRYREDKGMLRKMKRGRGWNRKVSE